MPGIYPEMRLSDASFDRRRISGRDRTGRARNRVQLIVNQAGRRKMAAQRFVEQLGEQIANEFAASQQYIANAVYYDGLRRFHGSPPSSTQQAIEERNHAMMMVQYLLDADAEARRFPVSPRLRRDSATSRRRSSSRSPRSGA